LVSAKGDDLNIEYDDKIKNQVLVKDENED
jgi:hypothetical protein